MSLNIVLKFGIEIFISFWDISKNVEIFVTRFTLNDHWRPIYLQESSDVIDNRSRFCQCIWKSFYYKVECYRKWIRNRHTLIKNKEYKKHAQDGEISLE